MSKLLLNIFVSLSIGSLLVQGVPVAERSCSTGKAIYFLTNNADNAVVAVPISTNGSLHGGTVTSIGGSGSNSIDGTTNQTAGPDALVSQGALSIAGKYLFTVNPGSNTLSMLAISPSDPTKLTLVGKPVAVPGDFPNTVAASQKSGLVCVGSTGAKAGISCSTFSPEGLSEMDTLRPFDLGQSTPPVGPTNTVSQIFFSQDESLLLTTVKGNPAVNNTGFVAAFPVHKGSQCSPISLATAGTRSSPAGTAVLFGTQQIPGTENIFATDASFGAAILSLDKKTNKASLVAKQAIVDQKATCWTTISPVTKSAFVTDVMVNHIVEMSLTDATIIKVHNTTSDNAGGGFIDLTSAGDFIYALSPGNGTSEAAVVVLDVSGGQGTAKVIQNFGVGALGAGKNAQGMVAAL